MVCWYGAVDSMATWCAPSGAAAGKASDVWADASAGVGAACPKLSVAVGPNICSASASYALQQKMNP